MMILCFIVEGGHAFQSWLHSCTLYYKGIEGGSFFDELITHFSQLRNHAAETNQLSSVSGSESMKISTRFCWSHSKSISASVMA